MTRKQRYAAKEALRARQRTLLLDLAKGAIERATFNPAEYERLSLSVVEPPRAIPNAGEEAMMRMNARAFAFAWERYHASRLYRAYANSVVRVLAEPGSYSTGEKAEIKKAAREIDAHMRKVKK